MAYCRKLDLTSGLAIATIDQMLNGIPSRKQGPKHGITAKTQPAMLSVLLDLRNIATEPARVTPLQHIMRNDHPMRTAILAPGETPLFCNWPITPEVSRKISNTKASARQTKEIMATTSKPVAGAFKGSPCDCE